MSTHTLSDVVMNDPAFVTANPCWVSVYESNEHFGGHEEGGWWYIRTRLIGSVRLQSKDAAEAYLAKAQAQAEELQSQANAQFKQAYLLRYGNALEVEDDFCAGETCGADRYEVCIEEAQGERDNMDEPVPYWE